MAWAELGVHMTVLQYREEAFKRDRDSRADKDLKKNELVLLSFAPHPFFT